MISRYNYVINRSLSGRLYIYYLIILINIGDKLKTTKRPKISWIRIHYSRHFYMKLNYLTTQSQDILELYYQKTTIDTVLKRQYY